jgi:hypothetical protein
MIESRQEMRADFAALSAVLTQVLHQVFENAETTLQSKQRGLHFSQRSAE